MNSLLIQSFVISGLGVFFIGTAAWLIRISFNNSTDKLVKKHDEEKKEFQKLLTDQQLLIQNQLNEWREERRQLMEDFNHKWEQHEKYEKIEKDELNQALKELENTLVRINNDMVKNFVAIEPYSSDKDKNSASHSRIWDNVRSIEKNVTQINTELKFFKEQIKEVKSRENLNRELSDS